MKKDPTSTTFKDFPFQKKDLSNKKPILTFVQGEQIGRHILLANDSILLGRSPDATIRFNDNGVSRLHLRVDYDLEHNVYVMNDLGSSNGTYVNDKQTTSLILKEGDKIFIGSTVLKFSLVDSIDIQYHGKMEQMISIDDLTGLIVKRLFDEELNRYIALAHKNKTHLSMIMMDLDGLKTINDTYGHQYGAYSISETGKIIKKIIGSRGLASRFGGDEFMAFILDATLEETKIIGEKIRCEVERNNYKKNEITIHPTISVGIAELKEGEAVEDLFKRADEALYSAKQKGRNRVEF